MKNLPLLLCKNYNYLSFQQVVNTDCKKLIREESWFTFVASFSTCFWHLTYSFSKLLSKVLNASELNVVTEIPEGKSMYPQWRFPRTPEHDIPHLLLNEKPYSYPT